MWPGQCPHLVGDVAKVVQGPALRRGALDKEGSEAVGGVVVVRYGENPLAAIKNVKEEIKRISPSLPKKVLPDGRTSKVTIVPFYDRTGLIHETLGTLSDALLEEILITIIVVVIALMHLRSSFLISGLLPLAVLLCFLAMKVFHVDANIVALSGIAVAIGTMVDMGIVICENIVGPLEEAEPWENRRDVVFRAASEVGRAVLTAVATTVISFLPVFTMEGAEGKLFRPLAFTKTFALIASLGVSLVIIPPAAHFLLAGPVGSLVRRIGSVLGPVRKLVLPERVAYEFAGTYKNQIRAAARLALVLPVALVIIFLILYLQFKSAVTANIVFSGIVVAWAGGFILIWLYGQPWFLNVELFGTSMRELFQVHPINLSVAIWVGFLALFGIASDDGVVMTTYLEQRFRGRDFGSIREIREATVAAGLRRVRPCLMTTATTILALLPVLTSTGRGSDVMVPMAIPTFGGMTIEIVTMLVVPVLYCGSKEIVFRFRNRRERRS